MSDHSECAPLMICSSANLSLRLHHLNVCHIFSIPIDRPLVLMNWYCKKWPPCQKQCLFNSYKNCNAMIHRFFKVLRFIWNHKRPHTYQAILNNKNIAGGTVVPDRRLDFRVTGIKTAWCWL